MELKNGFSQQPQLIQYNPVRTKTYLPCFDPDSLQIHFYMRMANINYSVYDSNYLYSPQAGDLPVLKIGNRLIESDKILNFLKKNFFDLDSNLTNEQKIEQVAWVSLIQSRLVPALKYLCWKNPSNSENSNSSLTDSSSTFFSFPWSQPLSSDSSVNKISNYLGLNWKIGGETSLSTQFCSQFRSKNYVDSVEKPGNLLNINSVEKAFIVIDQCLDALSKKLSNNSGRHKCNYFFGGENPTSIDAILAGNLSQFLVYDLPFKSNLDSQNKKSLRDILVDDNISTKSLSNNSSLRNFHFLRDYCISMTQTYLKEYKMASDNFENQFMENSNNFIFSKSYDLGNAENSEDEVKENNVNDIGLTEVERNRMTYALKRFKKENQIWLIGVISILAGFAYFRGFFHDGFQKYFDSSSDKLNETNDAVDFGSFMDFDE